MIITAEILLKREYIQEVLSHFYNTLAGERDGIDSIDLQKLAKEFSDWAKFVLALESIENKLKGMRNG